MLAQVFHSLIQLSGFIERAKLKRAFQSVQSTQSATLEKILSYSRELPWSAAYQKSLSHYQEFSTQIPISTWSDYQHHFTPEKRDNYLKNHLVQRFEPTSGSTFERKWIPMTEGYISELNRAASVWMSDLYDQYPDIKKGFHYWSLSWLPMELRADLKNDDSDLFPWWKKLLISKTFLSHAKLAYVSNEEAWRLGTIVYLLSNENLKFISVWSPTFLISLREYFDKNIELIFEVLNSGSFLHFSDDLKEVPFPKINSHFHSAQELKQKAFQNLELISCWTSGSSQIFIPHLQSLFPQSKIQGKGLWATEAVVTIPFEGQHPLCLRSHFYEFQDLKTGKIHLAHELKKGQQVAVIVSNSSGLLRYQLGDHLEVTGFFDQAPCFHFLGRPGTVDLVGEKLDLSVLRNILTQLIVQNPKIQFYQMGFCRQPSLRYLIFIEDTEVSSRLKDQISDQLELSLQKFHHYRVARQLGQLHSAEAILISDINLLKSKAKAGAIQGQMKQEDFIEYQS
jgi:hypothetical protein